MPSVPLPGEGGTKSPEAEKHQLKPILCKVIAQKEAFQVTLVVKNLLADAEDTRDASSLSLVFIQGMCVKCMFPYRVLPTL